MKLHNYELAVVGAEETKDGYVNLVHGQRYSLRITNGNTEVCDVEVTIDGNHVGTFRLAANTSSVIERPVHDDGYFTFYELVTEEARQAGIQSNDTTGLITAVFKEGLMSLFSSSLLSSPAPGGTGLSGHSNQNFRSLPPMRYTSPEDYVTINIRLGGVKDEIRPLVRRTMSTPIPPPLT